MGNISDKLRRLQEIKAAISGALIEMNQDVSNSDSFYSYASKIKNIQTAGDTPGSSSETILSAIWGQNSDKIVWSLSSNTWKTNDISGNTGFFISKGNYSVLTNIDENYGISGLTKTFTIGSQPMYILSGDIFEITPKYGLLFYAPLHEHQATAETGQTLTENGSISFENGYATFNNSSIGFNDAGFPTGNEDRTMTCLMKPNSWEDHYQHAFGYGTENQNEKFFIGLDYGEITFTGAANDVSTGYSNYNWTHVCVMMKKGEIRIYKDGQLILQRSNFGVSTVVAGNGKIGKNTINADAFNGSIMECKLWNRALSDAEVAAESERARCSIPAVPPVLTCLSGSWSTENVTKYGDCHVDDHGWMDLGKDNYFDFNRIYCSYNYETETNDMTISIVADIDPDNEYDGTSSTMIQFYEEGEPSPYSLNSLGWGRKSNKIFYHGWSNDFPGLGTCTSGIHYITFIQANVRRKLYVDGELIVNNYGSWNIFDWGNPLRVGKYRSDDWYANGAWKMKYFVMYNRELSSSELTTLHSYEAELAADLPGDNQQSEPESPESPSQPSSASGDFILKIKGNQYALHLTNPEESNESRKIWETDVFTDDQNRNCKYELCHTSDEYWLEGESWTIRWKYNNDGYWEDQIDGDTMWAFVATIWNDYETGYVGNLAEYDNYVWYGYSAFDNEVFLTFDPPSNLLELVSSSSNESSNENDQEAVQSYLPSSVIVDADISNIYRWWLDDNDPDTTAVCEARADKMLNYGGEYVRVTPDSNLISIMEEYNGVVNFGNAINEGKLAIYSKTLSAADAIDDITTVYVYLFYNSSGEIIQMNGDTELWNNNGDPIRLSDWGESFYINNENGGHYRSSILWDNAELIE